MNNCSDTFRELIAAVVEEVVVDGASLDQKIEFLKRFGRKESIDFDSFKEDIELLVSAIGQYKADGSKSARLMAVMQGEACCLSKEAVEAILSKNGSAPSESSAHAPATPSPAPQPSPVAAARPAEPRKDWKPSGPIAAVEESKGVFSYIDLNGNPITEIPKFFSQDERYNEGLAKFQNYSGLYGYKDLSGNIVIPAIFQQADPFFEGHAIVQLVSGSWAYIDRSGSIIATIPDEWGGLHRFRDGVAVIQDGEDQLVTLLFKDGSMKSLDLDADIERVGDFSEGLCPMETEEGLSIFVDKKGNIVHELNEYTDAGSFHEGLARVQDENSKYGYIDHDGNLAIYPRFEYARSFSEERAAVKSGGLFGFIDSKGRMVIPPKYDGVGVFKFGLAPVRLNGRWGYIDKNGTEVIPLKYNTCFVFSNQTEGEWPFENYDNL